MATNYHPSVDAAFIIKKISECPKIIPESYICVGNTHTFVQTGTKPMHKRLVIIRELEGGQVNFEKATANAILFGFMSDLLEWFLKHRNWKEGGYVKK